MMLIGITGHRDCRGTDVLAGVIGRVFAEIEGFAGDSLILLSPLAEGADRIAARVVMDLPGVGLRVLLPFPPDEYREDFATTDSRSEFDKLLARAESVEVMDPQSTRIEAYAMTGRTIVDRCDILIAVWDGEPARGAGGTADVVAYARELGRPLYWIDSDDPSNINRERIRKND